MRRRICLSCLFLTRRIPGMLFKTIRNLRLALLFPHIVYFTSSLHLSRQTIFMKTLFDMTTKQENREINFTTLQSYLFSRTRNLLSCSSRTKAIFFWPPGSSLILSQWSPLSSSSLSGSWCLVPRLLHQSFMNGMRGQWGWWGWRGWWETLVACCYNYRWRMTLWPVVAGLVLFWDWWWPD